MSRIGGAIVYAHAHAPVRIEIAGGATDLSAWTKHQPGLCLNLAIARYCHAVAIERPAGEVVASYSHLENARVATEIANGLIRESALAHGWETGFEIHTISEVPSRGSGLGASSSIAVALAALFSRMARARRGEATEGNDAPAAAARAAWDVEIGRLRRPIGRQDHMAAAWGGLRLYRFEGESAFVERSFSYDDAKWIAERIAILRLPGGHDAGAILAGPIAREQILPSYNAVPIACRAIEERNVGLLREAIGRVHEYKKNIPGSVTPGVEDVIATTVRVPGVLGATVAGAGGGGHVVVFFEEPLREDGAFRAVAETTGLPTSHVVPDVYGVRSEVWT